MFQVISNIVTAVFICHFASSSLLDKNEKTNDKLYVIASSINAITEFIVAEADYARLRQNETDKQLMAIALHLGNNLQE
jgi:hypothetical protein